MPSTARFLLLGLCTLILVLSVQVFASEYRVTFLLRGTVNDQIDRLAMPGSPPLPASARTARDLMMACGTILTTAPRPKGDPALAARLRQSCGQLAAEIIAQAPGNGRALAIALLASLPHLRADAIRSAAAAAPHEPWPLLMRIEAASLAPPDPDIAEAMAPDIVRALATVWGRERIARLYADRTDLRDRIKVLMQSLPQSAQSDFLRALRDAMRVKA